MGDDSLFYILGRVRYNVNRTSKNGSSLRNKVVEIYKKVPPTATNGTAAQWGRDETNPDRPANQTAQQ